MATEAAVSLLLKASGQKNKKKKKNLLRSKSSFLQSALPPEPAS